MNMGKLSAVVVQCLAAICLVGTGHATENNVAGTDDRGLGSTWAESGPVRAESIHRVDCSIRDDFFAIWNPRKEVCFANAGEVSVKIVNVYRIYSGNNVASVGYTLWRGGPENVVVLQKYGYHDFADPGTTHITRITIN